MMKTKRLDMLTEITVYRGIIVALVVLVVAAVFATIVSEKRIADMRMELTDAQRTAETYQDGYIAALQRASELEWQLRTMNGGEQ